MSQEEKYPNPPADMGELVAVDRARVGNPEGRGPRLPAARSA